VNAKRIIINRTDNIGDVILTLPMATAIKKHLPDSEVFFLGKPYTLPFIKKCQNIDGYLNWEDIRQDPNNLKEVGADLIIHVFNKREVAELAKKAGIRYRLGTSHRFYNLWTCNKLVHFGRSKSDLHEAQLNLKMLTPLGIKKKFSRTDVGKMYGWNSGKPDSSPFKIFFKDDKFNLIFHMKSYGNAKEWPASKFLSLAKRLPEEKFNLIISGTEGEGKQLQKEIPDFFKLPHSTDVSGKFSIDDFFNFVQCTDGLLSCSTGPLHMAAATGIRALGLYPSARPKHSGRWGPLGPRAEYIEDTNPLDAPLNIPVEPVYERLMNWIK